METGPTRARPTAPALTPKLNCRSRTLTLTVCNSPSASRTRSSTGLRFASWPRAAVWWFSIVRSSALALPARFLSESGVNREMDESATSTVSPSSACWSLSGSATRAATAISEAMSLPA